MMVDSDSVDRPAIADLELYGLSVRTINFLENTLGLLYLDELEKVSASQLLELPMFGKRVLEELRGALRNWLAKRPVKTVLECVRM